MSQFKVGDVVLLKSGSLPMTVTEVNPEWITVVWFGNSTLQPFTHEFPPAALEAQKAY